MYLKLFLGFSTCKQKIVEYEHKNATSIDPEMTAGNTCMQ